MKARSFKKFSMLAILIAMIASAVAQPQKTSNKPERGEAYCKAIPNLTEDQEKKIDALRIKHMKEMNDLKNQMAVKKAELRIIETADKPDRAAIDKKIDEIMSIKTQMAKKSAAHKQDVRSLLTDEQKVIFDTHKGKGPHSGKGNCPNSGGGKGQNDSKPGPNGPPHGPRQ